MGWGKVGWGGGGGKGWGGGVGGVGGGGGWGGGGLGLGLGLGIWRAHIVDIESVYSKVLLLVFEKKDDR